MAEALRTAYFDPELKTCVYADASTKFWCLVVMQCKPGDEKLPWDQQDGKHKLLFLKSGRFRHAQFRWPIVDKEAYPFGDVLASISHWINGGEYPAAFFTDHANLLAIFCADSKADGYTKPNRQRRERWALAMRELWYQIYHIDGEENRLPDLGTRWGNRFIAKAPGGAKKGMRIGPRMFMAELVKDDKNPRNECCRKCALRLPPPKLTTELNAPDLDVSEELLLPRATDMVDRNFLAKTQNQHATTKPDALSLRDGLWVNTAGEVWVPKGAKQLQHMLYAIAHQGPSGHRGRDVTLARLRGRFRWSSMRTDVEMWRKNCLQCIKSMKGDKVPRPLGTQLIPEWPGEILMFDYIKIRPSNSGYEYVLMAADKMSKLVVFTPADVASAIPASRSMGQSLWASRVVDFRRGAPLCQPCAGVDGGAHDDQAPRDAGALPVGQRFRRGRRFRPHLHAAMRAQRVENGDGRMAGRTALGAVRNQPSTARPVGR